MNVTYYANDMQEALEKIKNELGSDAIIISSKQVREKSGLAGLFSKKVYEVVANYDPKQQPRDNHNNTHKPAFKYSDFIKPKESEKMYVPNLSAYEYVARSVMEEEKGSNNISQPISQPTSQPSFEPQIAPKLNMPESSPDTKTGAAVDESQTENNLISEKQYSGVLDNMPSEKIEKLDDRITQLQNMINKFSDKFEYVKKDITYDYNPKIQSILEALIENDVPEKLAHEICQEAQKILDKKPDTIPKEIVAHLIKKMIGEVKTIQYKKFERRIIMIVGPTGVGKTTTLVKLVSQIVCNDKLKVGIINSDVYRVGAQEQLKNYIEILNIPLKTIFDVNDIHAALEEFEDMDFVFIDTAGKLSNDEEYVEDVKELIAEAQVDEIYLAISSTTSNKTAEAIINNYNFLGNYRLLVTKVDESPQRGQIINFCKKSGRPLSYFTVGQSVPDDIIKADVKAIIQEVM